MSTLVIEPQLYERIELAARDHKANVNQLFSDAIRQYLWELDRRKIAEESRAYRQLHAALKAQYLGQYIAMHEGQVVDHDTDFQVLRQRIRRRFGHTPILITLVEDLPERPVTRRGFVVET